MSRFENIGTVRPATSSYLWEIKNFTRTYKTCKSGQVDQDRRQTLGPRLISPVFSTNYYSINQEWCLHLFPESTRDECKEYVGLYLQYLGQNDVEVNVTLSLLDDKFSKAIQQSSSQTWVYEKGSIPHGWSKFMKLNFLKDGTNQLLVNDTINVLCEIIYDSDFAQSPWKRRRIDGIEQDLPDYSRLEEFDEFEKLLEAENSTDVIIKIGKEEIKVHKAIIMSRSPVFQAMFEHDMREKKESVVEITDIKYGIMKEVFRFIYVGKVNKGEEIADDLLVAADKYSIKGLKVLCEKLLSKNLKLINVVEYLQLAATYNSDNLKSNIIKFIVSNHRNVIHDPEFKALPNKVVLEVLYSLLSDTSNK